MGCFGINGGISKLPIMYGDECILLLGLNNKNIDIAVPDNFGTGFFFTPISLPIYGKYNDYGRIEDIVQDRNVQLIEDTLGYKIEDIIESIDNVMVGRYSKGNKSKKIYSDIIEKLGIDEKRYTLCITIEHKTIYDTLYKIPMEVGWNFEESIKLSLQFPYTFEDYVNNSSLRKLYAFEDPSIYDLNMIFLDLKKGYAKNVLNMDIDNGFEYKCPLVNVNPNFREGIFRYSSYSDTDIFLHLYKNQNTKILLEEMANEYAKFLTVFYKLQYLDWNLLVHNYSGQEGYKQLLGLKTYYQEIYEFIENQLKNFE